MKLFTDFMNYHQFFRQVVDEPEDIADEPQEVVDGSDDDEIRQGAKDLPGKIGKKKMEKLEAKAEKKRMREYELQVSFFVKTTDDEITFRAKFPSNRLFHFQINRFHEFLSKDS